jgi:hypothetical protein
MELQELRRTIDALRKQSHDSPHYMEALRSPLGRQLMAGMDTSSRTPSSAGGGEGHVKMSRQMSSDSMSSMSSMSSSHQLSSSLVDSDSAKKKKKKNWVCYQINKQHY